MYKRQVYIRILKESYQDLLGKGSFPFRPGMTANADIQTRRVSNAPSVPVNAVTTREKADSIINKGGPGADEPDVVVFVKNADNTVSPVIVTTGIQDINYMEIKSGLKPGQDIISGPYELVSKTLKKGSKVQVVEKKDLYEVKDKK